MPEIFAISFAPKPARAHNLLAWQEKLFKQWGFLYYLKLSHYQKMNDNMLSFAQAMEKSVLIRPIRPIRVLSQSDFL
ncbi:MAG: hypothetical protein NTX50_27855 [Candidatus Sumerlaeota bacterium]|nr:hypothetical protein [Candidatus Sumerlaeota bacterium]